MATTNFVAGTLIESTWLNDADAHVYDQATAAHTAANIAVVDTAGNFTATDVEGVLAEISAGAGGLQYFTEGRSIAAPNATVPVHSFTAFGTETNIDAALIPKGTGALVAQVADSTATGGNKRGPTAVDLQRNRSLNTQVASGAFSVLCGGSGNTASGSIATLSGGLLNTSSGITSVVSGGDSNTASGSASVVGGGDTNTASGTASCILGGEFNTADGQYSVIIGGLYSWVRGLLGKSCFASGSFATTGDAQIGLQVLRGTTTDATPSITTSDGGVASSTNVSVLPDNYSYCVSALVTARNTATGDTATWKVEGAIKRGANAAATALVGTPTVTSLGADAGMAGAVVALIADTTLGAAEIQVTGIAATTIHWVCKFNTVEAG